MKKINIIVDQALDIPKYVLDRYDIRVVNLNVSFGDEVVNHFTNEQFYERMKVSSILPKTSCPSPEAFLEAYKSYDGDIMVVTLSKELSGTYASAVLAKEIYESDNGKNRVEIIDSTNGSIGAALPVIKAAEMIDKNEEFETVVLKLNDMTKTLIHYGTLETLENAVKGGRVSKTKGFVANALNLKPIIQIEKTVFVVDKARGTKNSIKKMIEILESKISENGTKPSLLGIAHANDIEKAELVKSLLLDKYDFEEVIIAEIGPIIGTYTAEGGILVSVI